MDEKKFRILLIDDNSYDIIKDHLEYLTGECESCSDIIDFLAKLAQYDKNNDDVEVYLSGKASIYSDYVIRLRPDIDMDFSFLDQDREAENWLKTINILILDLGGTGEIRERWKLTKKELPSATKDELDAINSEWGSIALFLKFKDNLLHSCDQIIILSQFDTKGRYLNEYVVKFIDMYCHPDQKPVISKFPIPQGFKEVISIIDDSIQAFKEGYVIPKNREAIEFAASHDYPVLIIGESGTGKEYIARSIHRRWVQKKKSKGVDINDEFVVIHCGALLTQLARSELFGHVKGSFSDAQDHRLGKILRACGITIEDNPKSYPTPETYRKLLLSQNKGKVKEISSNSFDLGIIGNGPFGTIFLDEFGDLPLEVQSLLLRYLESWEIEPIGYPGRILNVRTRIIAATSDPSVAEAIGIKILEPPRPKAHNYLSLRNDLLYRVSWQRIRAVGVRETYLEQDIRKLVRSKSKMKWTDEAIKVLIEHVRKKVLLIKDYFTKKRKGSTNIYPTFGHLREITQLILIIDKYVETAYERGLRSFEGTAIKEEVTPEIVKKLCKEMSVTSLYLEEQEPSTRWTLEDFVNHGIVEENTKEYSLLKFFLDNPNKKFSIEDLIKIVNPDSEDPKNAVRALISKLKKKISKITGNMWTEESGWVLESVGRPSKYFLRHKDSQ